MEGLRGKRIFMTGGTGWLGGDMVELFTRANREQNLGAHLTILSRNPPANAPNGVSFVRGEGRSFQFPQEHFDYVIHAARGIEPQATNRALELARHRGNARFMLFSSGAVYSPMERTGTIAESCATNPTSEYGRKKKEAEGEVREYVQRWRMSAVIVRPFTFIGPRMPLDGDYAAGNFIRDAIAGKPIEVKGDGTAVRSYMDSREAAYWFWLILTQGSSEVYNVGSEDEISMKRLAEMINGLLILSPGVSICGDGERVGLGGSRYIPSTERARHDLHITAFRNLEQSIRDTIGAHL